MKQLREFIFPCIDVSGVMVPEHRYAELEEIVRCKNCVWYAHLRMMCRRGDFTVLDPMGYCKWGERKP